MHILRGWGCSICGGGCISCTGAFAAGVHFLRGCICCGGHRVHGRPALALLDAHNPYGTQPLDGLLHRTLRQTATHRYAVNRRPAHPLVVRLVCQRDKHRLLRRAHSLERPAGRHDDRAHLRVLRDTFLRIAISCRDTLSCWMVDTCVIFGSVGCSAPPSGASSESPVAAGLFAVCSTGCLNRGRRDLTSASTSQ